MKKQADWLSTDEALARLGVKRQSLYAYVSRGLVRVESDPGDSRRRLYFRHDVDRLVARRSRPRRREDVAAGAMRWGEPVLKSGISTIRDGRLFFGEEDACRLADASTLEAVARHHWRMPGDWQPDAGAPVPLRRRDPPPARAYHYLAVRAAAGLPSLNRSHRALCTEAWAILNGFADALLGARHPGAIHDRVATAWGLGARHGDLIRRALVLLSDHELNASTFAVRVAASTGAPLGAASLAGLAALSGPLHGHATESAIQFLRAAIDSGAPHRYIGDLLSHNQVVPGMGHHLYPDGDVRAQALLDALQPSGAVRDAIRICEDAIGRKPNIDIGLAALAVDLHLPDLAGFSLFALGRMAGWLGHAMEQRLTGSLIRPRADYAAWDPPSTETR